MTHELLDIDALLNEFDNLPQHDECDDVDMTIEDTYAYVRMYRGSDTTDVQGISWWTTDKKLAMGTYYNGVLMERTIRIPIDGTVLRNACGYVLGHRGGQPIVGRNYSYGTDNDVDVRMVQHFNISIHEYALQFMTTCIHSHGTDM